MFDFLFFHFSRFILFSYLRKFLVFSIYGLYNFYHGQQSVGAGMDTLMSISDGLGPSLFCRMMEKARPIREEMDGKVVYFPPESAFWLRCSNLQSTFSSLYLDLACNQLCFPPGEGINRRNESTDLEPLLSLCSTDDINQYWYFHYYKTVKQQFDFSSKKLSIIILQQSLFP